MKYPVPDSQEDRALNALAVAYARSREESLGQRLYEAVSKDIQKILQQYIHNNFLHGQGSKHHADITSDAHFGFAKAAQKYEIEKGDFRLYCKMLVRCEIQEGIRNRKIHPRATFQKKLPKEERLREVSLEALENFVSNGQEEVTQNLEDVHAVRPHDSAIARELRGLLARDLEEHPERTREVFRAYFFEGRRCRDIGVSQGVSEPRIYQILCKLREEGTFVRTKDWLGVTTPK